MTSVTQEQIKKAFQYWKSSVYKKQEFEDKLEPFLDSRMSAYVSEKFEKFEKSDRSKGSEKPGWLRQCREALFLSTGEVAQRMGVSRSAYSKLESAEELGTISLKKLSMAAEALDAELIIAIRPKKKMLFSQIIWQKLLPTSVNHYWVKSRPEHVKAQALLTIVKKQMQDPEFRALQKWTERKWQK